MHKFPMNTVCLQPVNAIQHRISRIAGRQLLENFNIVEMLIFKRSFRTYVFCVDCNSAPAAIHLNINADDHLFAGLRNHCKHLPELHFN